MWNKKQIPIKIQPKLRWLPMFLVEVIWIQQRSNSENLVNKRYVVMLLFLRSMDAHIQCVGISHKCKQNPIVLLMSKVIYWQQGSNCKNVGNTIFQKRTLGQISPSLGPCTILRSKWSQTSCDLEVKVRIGSTGVKLWILVKHNISNRHTWTNLIIWYEVVLQWEQNLFCLELLYLG